MASLMRRNARFLTLAGALALLLVLAYANHFQNGFQFDDSHTIVNNTAIRSLANVPRYFTDATTFSTLPANQGYRPFFTTLNAIDYWLAGSELDVFTFHLSIFLSYVVLIVLLYLLFLHFLRTVFDTRLARLVALLSAAFFSLHTANAETINYVSARSDSFSTLMVAAALVSYIYLAPVRKYHLYLIPLILGFLVKEPTLMFIPLLFLYVLLFEEKVPLSRLLASRHREGLFRALKATAPSILTAVILVVLYVQMTPESLVLSTTPWLNYLVTQSFVVAHYFYAFFLPVNLSADSDWVYFTNLLDDRVISGCLVIFGLLAATWLAARRDETKPLAFGLLWFFLALAPSSSIVPLAEVVNDHRTFFPYVGLTLALGTAVGHFYHRLQDKPAGSKALRAGLALLIAAVLLGHAYGTRQRNKVWKNGESLWHDVTVKSPRNGRGLMNYGVALMAKGRLDEAESYFQRAQQFVPHYSVLHINMGILHGRRDSPEKARQFFQNAINYDKGNPNGYYFYGQWLAETGELEEAAYYLEQALKLSPNLAEAQQLLQQLQGRLSGDWTPTVAALAAVESDPTHDNYVALSLAYFNDQKYRDSVAACQKALELEPNSSVAYNNLCSAYNGLQMWQEAVTACERALEIDPGFELARNNLAWARQNLAP